MSALFADEERTGPRPGKRKKKPLPLYRRVAKKKGQMPATLYTVLYGSCVILHVCKKFLKTFLVAGLIGFLAAFAIILVLFAPTVLEWKMETDTILASSSAEDFSINESSTVYDSSGTVIAVLRESADQEYVPYSDLPKDVVNAFVAVEDRTFFENAGIDLKGLMRVGIRYITSQGEEVHGASTITQQLARNVYLSHDVSIERKAKEIFLALGMTEKYSKEEIMEFYANNICFANGIYGIAGAAKAYFDKPVEDLSLSECAYLCAIPNRPAYYDPYVYPEHALERRDKILGDMLETGYITQEKHDAALAEEIAIRKPAYEYNSYETTYAVDCAVRYLMEDGGFAFEYEWDTMEAYDAYQETYEEAYAAYKHKLYTGGYQIYTSLDTGLGETLQEVLDSQLSFDTETDGKDGAYCLQGAAAIVDNSGRKVVAIVGGRSQEEQSGVYGLNRAYQAPRQPGSSLKPLAVYTPALMEGYTASSIVENIDVSKAREAGADVQAMTGTKVTLRQAVEKSLNGVAWKLFDELGPSYALSYLQEMHFANIVPNDYYNASSLGGLTYGVTAVEMAAAYSTLANHGEHVDATCLVSVIGPDGEELYQEPAPVEIYNDKAADDMVDILEGVLESGTAKNLKWKKATDTGAFAKTGTTNDSKDGWFCGATPYYSIAVWVGYDSPKTLPSLWGSSYPASIWKEAMLAAIDGLPAAGFERNYEDESYSWLPKSETYYSYLEGRDDNEVLSSGYTVGDYRSDRVIGEDVQKIIGQMSKMSGMSGELEALYQEGCLIVDSIYSMKYTAEMQAALDAAYTEAAARSIQPAGETVPAQ